MRTPASFAWMTSFITAVSELDTEGKLKLTVSNPATPHLFEINDPEEKAGYYIYCDNLFCSVQYRHFGTEEHDVFTLTEQNIAPCAHEVYTTLMSV